MKQKSICAGEEGWAHEVEEVLECIWTLWEKGIDDVKTLLKSVHADDPKKWVEALQEQGLITVANGIVRLTPQGEEEARQIIRRHRLTERLFADVFATSQEVWEREACELEHQTVLVEEAVNAVCAFLGHPTSCPHGRLIPRGSCCAEFKKELKPFVIPLTNAAISETYRIVFITPKSAKRLDRLSVLGIIPGSDIRMRQKKPSCVIRIGETDVALDQEIVKDIYVKRINY